MKKKSKPREAPQLACDPQLLEKLPREVAERLAIAPLAVDAGTAIVAIADPGNVAEAERELTKLVSASIEFVPASREAILGALARGYKKVKPAKSVYLRTPDSAGMTAAIRSFLGAAGLDTNDAELAETPARVAEAWIGEYLDGYSVDARELLSEIHPAKSRDLVIVKSIDFHSTCPHHLVPYRGVAHVGYLPKRGVVGFGKIVRVVEAFAHRLTLQEQIGDEVVEALMKHVGARGAACVLDAEQACLTTRGPKSRNARTITRSFRGALQKDRKLRDAFLRSVGK